MKKQKKLSAFSVQARILNYRRAVWIFLTIFGVFAIQLAYNFHAGQPKIMGVATQISKYELLTSTNNLRRYEGLSELSTNTTLDQAAQDKAEDMVNNNYWNHIAPDGKTPWSFLDKHNYRYQAAGENLAYGFSTGNEITAAWSNSADHRANLFGDYKQVGFGVSSSKNYQAGDNTVVVALYTKPLEQATNSQVKSIPATNQHVNGLAVVISGNATWATYASGGLICAAVMSFLVTHLELLRLGWYRGKKFLFIHPALDLGIVITLAVILVYAAGGFIK